LSIETPPALVPKVVTWALSPATVAASGQFRIGHTYYAQTFYTSWLNFNETAANIKSAIEALPSFRQHRQSITISSTIAAATSLTATYGSEALNEDDYDYDANLVVESTLFTAGPVQINVNSTFTHAVPGWTAGSYNIICMGAAV